MIAVQSQVSTCDVAMCRATGQCRGYPWRCHRSMAALETPREGGPAASSGPQKSGTNGRHGPAILGPRLPASEIGT